MESKIIIDGKMVDRRTFLKMCGASTGALLLATSFPKIIEATSGKGEYPFEKITIARGDPGNLDTAISMNRNALMMYEHLYDRLVYRDLKMKLIPQLATEWNVINENTWRFKLREGVRFHDGTEFDAEDMKFSMDRIMDPKVASPQLASFRGIQEAVVVNKRTIDLKFDSLPIICPAQLYLSGWPISKEFFYGKDMDFFSTNACGTGMYKLVEWVRGDKLVMEAFDDYWGEPKAPSKYLIWRFIGESSTRVSALKTGDIDIAAFVPPEEISVLEKNPDTKIAHAPTSRIIYIYLRTDRDTPLKNKKVRQAFNYAVDKEAISKSIGLGYLVPLPGQPGTSFHFGTNPNIKAYPYDPQKAKQLLKEAGYPNGFKVSFGSFIGRVLKPEETATAVAGYLREIGIEVQHEISAFSVFYSKWQKKDPPWDMAMMSWGGYSTFDPEGTFPYIIESGGPQSHYSNKEVDSLIAQARVEKNIGKREKLYFKCMEILHDDPPMIYLTANAEIHGYRSRLNFKARADGIMSARMITKP
ncbi:MAG: ABC transporter substrate-binding protein [bacterium]